MTASTAYGTWCNSVNQSSTSPDHEIDEYVGTGDPEWRERLESTGALGRMRAAYRAEINAALPGDIALCGDEFIGPAVPEDGEFDGYPLDKNGFLDFAAMVEHIDIVQIVDQHDPDIA